VAFCNDFSRLESRSHKDASWKAALTKMPAGKPLSQKCQLESRSHKDAGWKAALTGISFQNENCCSYSFVCEYTHPLCVKIDE